MKRTTRDVAWALVPLIIFYGGILITILAWLIENWRYIFWKPKQTEDERG